MAIIKKNTNKNTGEYVEKREPCTLLMGMVVGIVTVENNVEFLKSKNRTSI